MNKKGKKGKKGSGKKKAKSKEPQMTAQEAILAYQINVVEKKLEDIQYEIRGWEEKNRRHEERNEKLKEEQELLLQHLLKTARDVYKVYESEEIKTRDDVIIAMKDKWSRQRTREKEVEELKSQIARTMVERDEVQKKVDHWALFRDVGSLKQQTHIAVLEQELRDMQKTFDEMSTHLHQNLLKNKGEIEKYTDETLAQQKDKASDKAMAQLDKNDRQEVLDNDWLKKEVQIHRGETAKVREWVEDLEKSNLDMMSKLFDCTVEDLKVSRTFYLTQFDETDDVEKKGILEMDLAQLTPMDPDMDSLASAQIRKRPGKSAVAKAVEDKVFSLTSEAAESPTASGDEEAEGSESFDSALMEEEDFDDYLTLGPVELKLLSIAGYSKPIHETERPSSSEMAMLNCRPDHWPVTQPMMKKVLDVHTADVT